MPAAIGYDAGRILPNAVANYHVQDVAGYKPGEHEDAENGVAQGSKTRIFEALGKLSQWLALLPWGGPGAQHNLLEGTDPPRP